MNITPPAENPNIPEKLQGQITAVRNQITIGESEIKRLRELEISLKYTIGELSKEKSGLDSDIASIADQKNFILSEIEHLGITKATLLSDKSKLETEIEVLKKQISDRENVVRVKEADIEARTSKLENDIQNFNDDKESLNTLRIAHEKKVAKLKEALL